MKKIQRTRAAGIIGIVFLFAAVPVLFVLSGCGGESSAQNNAASNGTASKSEKSGGQGPRIEVAMVQTRDLVRTVEMPGTVEGYETAALYAKVGGYLREFAVHPETNQPIDIGDSVSKGQKLAWLDIPEMEKQLNQKRAAVSQAEAEIEQAQAAIDKAIADLKSHQASFEEAKTERAEKEAQLEFRRSDYERIKSLVDSQSVRRELLDQAKYQRDAAEAALKTVAARIDTAEANRDAAAAHVEKAKADHKTAQARLRAAEADADYVRTMMEYAVIKAPFDGVVTKRWVHPGDFIQPAEGNSAAKPLLTVTRTDIVRVFLDISMNDVRLLDRGDRAILGRINVLPGQQVEGEVTRFSPALNVGSRMMRVEVDLPNEEGLLLPGYYGYMTVYLEELKQTPVIPSSALLTRGEEAYVFCCENGRVHKRVVRTNYQDGTWVGIESGLQGGEKVVRAGGGQMTDGQEVVMVVEGS